MAFSGTALLYLATTTPPPGKYYPWWAFALGVVGVACGGLVFLASFVISEPVTLDQRMLEEIRDLLKERLLTKEQIQEETHRTPNEIERALTGLEATGEIVTRREIIYDDQGRVTGEETVYASGRRNATAFPETIKATADVPTPAAIGTEEREVLDVTPEYLTNLYKGRTTYQAEQSIVPFLQRWMRASGIFDDLTQEGSERRPPIVFSARVRHEPGRAEVFLRFDAEWRDRVLVLKPGDHINVVGQLVRTWPNAIQLVHCELVP